MNPFTAIAIFGPLSIALAIASGNLKESPKHPVTTISEENLKELSKDSPDFKNNYLIYKSYETCVNNVTTNASANNASSKVKETCNPILNKLKTKG